MYRPTVQEVHTDVPVVNALYEPVAHAVQPADVLAVSVLPNEPAKHPVQADMPVVSAL